MAVIREQRQFKIGPIGIARASRAGVITGEAVARAGAQAQEYFFRRAVEDAQKAGVEAAGSLEASEVVALDPETGRPKLYEGPKGFGRYAQQAYQKVLLQRFEQEIGIEIEDKSKELALKFRRSPEGFNQAMSDYIAEMSNVEESTIFKQEIQRVGKAVQTSKYRALQAQAIARQEQNDKLAYRNSYSENLASIEDTYAVGDFNLGVEMVQAGQVLDQDNIAAGVILSNQAAGHNRARKIAVAKGMLRYELQQALKSNPDRYDLAQALNAIDSGDVGSIPDGLFPQLRNVLSAEGSVFTEEIAQFGTELIQDGINQINLKREIDSRNRQADAMLSSTDIASEYFDVLGSSVSDIAGNIGGIAESFNIDRQSAIDALRDGASQAEIDSYTAESGSRLQSQADALSRRMIHNADGMADIINIQSYIKNPTEENHARIKSEESKALARTLVEVAESTGQTGLIDAADRYAESISDEERFKEVALQEQNAISYSNYLKQDFSQASFGAVTTDAIESAVSAAISKLDSDNIDASQKENFRSIINNKTSESYFRIAFNTAKTPEVISAMQLYARDGDDKSRLLTDKQREMIDSARKYSDDASYYTTNLNEYSRRAKQRYDNRVSAAKDSYRIQAILNNSINTDGFTEAERRRIDTQLNIPQDYYRNPNYNSEQFAELNAVAQRISPSYWPQAQYDTIRSFLNGQISETDQVERVLATYATASKYVTDAGFEISSGGLSGLNADEIALMNEAVAFGQQNNDVQAMMQHLNTVREFRRDPARSKAMDGFFSQKSEDGLTPKAANLTEYVTYTFPETQTNTRLRDRLISEARVRYFASFTEGRDEDTLTNIQDHLQGIIDKEFVEDDRIISMDGSNKTMMPLSKTVGGFEDEFINHIRANMKRMTTNKEIDWDTAEFKLMPVGYNEEDKGMTYGVVLMDGATRNLQEVEMYFDENDPSVVLPAFFSTNEPIFAAIKKNKQMQTATNLEDIEQILSTGAFEVKPQMQPEGIGPFGPLPTYESQTPVGGDIGQMINTKKYERLFSGNPLIGRLYSRLANNPSQKVAIRLLSSFAKNIDSDLANELQVDLQSMLEIIGE